MISAVANRQTDRKKDGRTDKQRSPSPDTDNDNGQNESKHGCVCVCEFIKDRVSENIYK